MSHGQATVERGFSVNKEVAVENLTERSFIAQRIIHDHIESVGGLANVEISKQLLTSSAGARQKYLSYLDDQKRSKVSQENALKRKSTMEEIDVLKKKNDSLKMMWRVFLSLQMNLLRELRIQETSLGLLNQTVYGEPLKKRWQR